MRPTMNNERILKILMRSLKNNFSKGLSVGNIVRQILRFPKDSVDLSEIDYLVDVVRSGSATLKQNALKVLSHFGYDINNFQDIVLEQNSSFISTFIKEAEKSKNLDALLIFLEEDSNFLNQTIHTIYKLGEYSYLSSLVFSQNNELSCHALRIIEMAKEKVDNTD